MFVANADGLLFGRLFETAQFGWIAGVEPACELYTTAEIPTIDNGYSGSNPTGFSNPDYDQACDLAHRSLPGTAAYIQNQYQAQKIFAENLPSIPLYLTVKMAVARPDLTGLDHGPDRRHRFVEFGSLRHSQILERFLAKSFGRGKSKARGHARALFVWSPLDAGFEFRL